jgi:endonuclease/exonuclease/phosphatase (EEP) superfamily protein YafD
MLCWAYVLATVGILGILRVAGDRWWVATLMLFSPRWIWAAPLPFLGLMVLVCRRWKLLLPMVISGVIVLFGEMEFRVPWRQAIPDGSTTQTLRIVTCNLHNIESDPNVLNAFVTENNPDIILLQDYTQEREPLMVQQGGWYRHPYNGMYIASRYPFGKFENLLPVDSAGIAYETLGLLLGKADCYEVDMPGGPFHLVNVHLASAHRSLSVLRQREAFGPELMTANSRRRRAESMAISARVNLIGGPFIIAGDFNTPDDSPIFRQAWWRFRDGFSDAGFGFGTTYAKHHTWLRIDHVLSDGGWHCVEFRTGPDVGSGHRPIIAVFER